MPLTTLLSLTAYLLGLLNALLLLLMLPDGSRPRRALCLLVLALVALFVEGLLIYWPDVSPQPWLLLPQLLILPSFYHYLQSLLEPNQPPSWPRQLLITAVPISIAVLFLEDNRALPLLLISLGMQLMIYLKMTLPLLQRHFRKTLASLTSLVIQLWLLWMLRLCWPLLPFEEYNDNASWLLPVFIGILMIVIGAIGLFLPVNEPSDSKHAPPQPARPRAIADVLDEEELTMLQELNKPTQSEERS